MVTASRSIGEGTSVAVLDLDAIRGLTDVGAMTRLLHQTIALERNIDAELDLLLGQRVDLEKKLLGLHKVAEVLELVKSDSDQMLNSVEGTCSLAEHVSGKVRELDLAQSRVHETIARLEAIADRTNCIEGVKTALGQEDYEAAARYVQTFLQLERDFSHSEGVEGPADTAVEQRKQLMLSKSQLEDVIRKKFAAAAEERDQAAVERFAKLFSPLGLQPEGLRAYVGYLRRVVAVRAREEYEALQEALEEEGDNVAMSEARVDFAEYLTRLFQDIALAVEHNEELVREMYAEDGMVWVVRDLQEEADTRGATILKRYLEARRIAQLVRDVAGHKAVAGAVVSTSPEGPDLRQVELCLEEMLMLSRRSEEYMHFMAAKVAAAEAAGAAVSPRAASRLRTGGLSRAVLEVAAYYVQLEEFFIVENVRKAIRIDEPAGAGVLTTSMVDDVFYILQKCAGRAISTRTLHPVLACLSVESNLLNNEFREALQRRLREPNLAQKLFSVAGAASSKTANEVATALNNADVSAEYALKLRHHIEEHCAEVFPGAAERERLKGALNELSETSVALSQVAAAGAEQLANSVTPRLRVLLDAVATVSYELSEAQYADNEVNDPWVQQLLQAVESSVAWLQALLTPNNFDALVHLVIAFIVKRVEALMMQKRFNQLGGLQLERDARALVAHFLALTQRTVRDKFARLTQMATLLSSEKAAEILDYWGDNAGPMTWRLTPAEVRRILTLRVDFKPEVIAALKL